MPILRSVLSVARLAPSIRLAPCFVRIKQNTKINPAIGARLCGSRSIVSRRRHPNTIAIAMLLPVEIPALPNESVPEPFVVKA